RRRAARADRRGQRPGEGVPADDDGGARMSTALVRSELRKITSTRLWWGLLVGAVIYTVIQAGANAAIAGTDPGAGQPATPALDTAQAIRTVYATSAFTGAYIFAMILGITGMTGEYRYQTITPTVLATPRRARVVLAKLGAHLGVGGAARCPRRRPLDDARHRHRHPHPQPGRRRPRRGLRDLPRRAARHLHP